MLGCASEPPFFTSTDNLVVFHKPWTRQSSAQLMVVHEEDDRTWSVIVLSTLEYAMQINASLYATMPRSQSYRSALSIPEASRKRSSVVDVVAG